MQRRGPTPHVVHLHLAQRQLLVRRKRLQARKGVGIQRERARGEAPLDLQMNQVALDVLIDIHDDQPRAGSTRESAALAISPMRTRNSVPISAA